MVSKVVKQQTEREIIKPEARENPSVPQARLISVSFQKPCESLLGAQDNEVPAWVEAVYAACLLLTGLMM